MLFSLVLSVVLKKHLDIYARNISLRGDASLPSHPFFAHCKSSNRRVSPRSPHVASTTSGAAHLKHFYHRGSVAIRAWDVLTEGCVDGRLRWLFAVKSRQRIGCRSTLSWSSPSCPPSERLTPTPLGAMFFYRTGDYGLTRGSNLLPSPYAAFIMLMTVLVESLLLAA